MDITRWAIRNNRVTTVALLIIFVAGLASYYQLPKDEDPGFIVRTALVMTVFPGASPERVEQLVTDKLEEAISEIPEIDFINSESKTGVSLLFVNVQQKYRDLRPIWDSLRRKVAKVQEELPDSAMPTVINDEFGDVYGTLLTITGEGYSYRELEAISESVRKDLLRIDEVAKVELYGEQEERIFVEFNNSRLKELGISPSQLSDMLRARNIIIPGGSIRTNRERITLEPTGNFESIEDLRRTVVAHPSMPAVLTLEDIADIRRAYRDPPSAVTRFNGDDALLLAINLRKGGNIIELGNKVRERVAYLQTQYPIGINLDFAAFQADHVDRKVDDFTENLFQAVALVLLVMLVTLGLRTGLVVAALIPMTMLMSLLLMMAFGIGIDQMSLASLIIALGMLVDNAIVMSESIIVGINNGEDPTEVAVRSARELRLPLLTSSLTTAVAFLPIFMAESNVGEYTAPLFKVVTIALLSSWILSITMTPLLSVHFLKRGKAAKDEGGSPLFKRSLLVMLRHRAVTLVAVGTVFLVAMGGFGLVPQIFFPPNDKAIMTAEFNLPIGTPIERTMEVTAQIEQLMQELRVGAVPEGGVPREDGIVNWASFVGRGAPRFVMNYNPSMQSPEYAMMIINTSSQEAIAEVKARLEAFTLEKFPDVRPTISKLSVGPPAGAPVEVRISGTDTDRIFEIVAQVKEELAKVPGISNISDNWGARSKKLFVRIDEVRTRRAGLTNLDVAVSLQTVLSGYESTRFRDGDKSIPVMVRTVAADREDIGKLDSHNVYSLQSGRSVPLKQVAETEVAWQPAKVRRRDRLRTVTVSAYVAQDQALRVSGEIKKWLAGESKDWPVGYLWKMGGEEEKSGDANKSIGDKLPYALLIIVLLLISQFNSVRRTSIILMTIPLGLIGVVAGLLVARSYFGFMTLLGIISLAGIVINNGIVLLDRIRIEIDENGLSPQDAIVVAAGRRLRPILLTTATTIGGLLPLWAGGGPMWEPMAIAIIFGLLFSTVMTLGVVPVLYASFFGVRFKKEGDAA